MAKLKFETPQLVRLSKPVTALGFCDGGSGATATCDDGPSVSGCGEGSGASGDCAFGENIAEHP
jgi:hypothetical protein